MHDGGAENERNMRRNIEAFEEIELTPRYMVDVSEIDTRADTEIVGTSPAITKAVDLAALVAPVDTTVLILGESGTGKEVLVKALAMRPGHVKSRDVLMDAAYGEHIYVDDRTIDSHIKRIRKKFKAIDADFGQIETLYGVGYRYKETAEAG